MKEVILKHSKKNIFDALHKIAENLDLDIENTDLVKGLVSLYSVGDFFSFGNKISVEIFALDTNKSLIKITSKSVAAIQVFDWGTNGELENNIIDELTKFLS